MWGALLFAALFFVTSVVGGPQFVNPRLVFDPTECAAVFSFDRGSGDFPEAPAYLVLDFGTSRGGFESSAPEWEGNKLRVLLSPEQLRASLPQKVYLRPHSSTDIPSAVSPTLSLDGYPDAVPVGMKVTFPGRSSFSGSSIVFSNENSEIIFSFTNPPASLTAPGAPALAVGVRIDNFQLITSAFNVDDATCTLSLNGVFITRSACDYYDQPFGTQTSSWRRYGVTLTDAQTAAASTIQLVVHLPRSASVVYSGSAARANLFWTGAYFQSQMSYPIPKTPHVYDLSINLQRSSSFGTVAFEYKCANSVGPVVPFVLSLSEAIPELSDFATPGHVIVKYGSSAGLVGLSINVTTSVTSDDITIYGNCGNSSPIRIDVDLNPPTHFSTPVSITIASAAIGVTPPAITHPLVQSSQLFDLSFSVDSDGYATLGWSGYEVGGPGSPLQLTVIFKVPHDYRRFQAYDGRYFTAATWDPSIIALAVKTVDDGHSEISLDLPSTSVPGSIRFLARFHPTEKDEIGGANHVSVAPIELWVKVGDISRYASSVTHYPLPRADGIKASYSTPFALLSVDPGLAATTASTGGKAVTVTVNLNRKLNEFDTSSTTCAAAGAALSCAFVDNGTGGLTLTVTVPAEGLVAVDVVDPVTGAITQEPPKVMVQLVQEAPTLLPGVRGTVTVGIEGDRDSEAIHFYMPAATVPYISGLEIARDEQSNEVVLTWDEHPWDVSSRTHVRATTYELGTNFGRLGRGRVEGVAANLVVLDENSFLIPANSTGARVPVDLPDPLHGSINASPYSTALVFMQKSATAVLPPKATAMSWSVPEEAVFGMYTADSSLTVNDTLPLEPLIFAVRVDPPASDAFPVAHGLYCINKVHISWPVARLDLSNIKCVMNDGEKFWPTSDDLSSVPVSAGEEGTSIIVDTSNSEVFGSHLSSLQILCEGAVVAENTLTSMGMMLTPEVRISYAPISSPETMAEINVRGFPSAFISPGPDHLVLTIYHIDLTSSGPAMSREAAESMFPTVHDIVEQRLRSEKIVTSIKIAGTSVADTVRLLAIMPPATMRAPSRGNRPFRQLFDAKITLPFSQTTLTLPASYLCDGQECWVRDNGCGYRFQVPAVCHNAGALDARVYPLDDVHCTFANNKDSLPRLPFFGGCSYDIDTFIVSRSGSYSGPKTEIHAEARFFPPGTYTMTIPRSTILEAPKNIPTCGPDSPLPDLLSTNATVCEQTDQTIKGTFTLQSDPESLKNMRLSILIPPSYFPGIRTLPDDVEVSTFTITGPAKTVTGSVRSFNSGSGGGDIPPSSGKSSGLAGYIIAIIVVVCVIAVVLVAFLVYWFVFRNRAATPSSVSATSATAGDVEMGSTAHTNV